MSGTTTFEIFQQLMTDAVDASTSLTSTLKAAMKMRISAMSRTEKLVFGAADVESAAGNTSIDLANNAVLIALGVPATPNRVEFKLRTLATPSRIVGSDGVSGMVVGHTGEASVAAVATDDMTFQYRLSTSGAWSAFTRNTVLDSVTTIQFAVVIASQLANVSLPQLWILGQQL